MSPVPARALPGRVAVELIGTREAGPEKARAAPAAVDGIGLCLETTRQAAGRQEELELTTAHRSAVEEPAVAQRAVELTAARQPEAKLVVARRPTAE
jgi:hypothetical protein